MPKRLSHAFVLAAIALAGWQQADDKPASRPTADHLWLTLFNGRNLEGWTPKFAGHPAGTNVRNTFRVHDGNLVVSYDEYESFDGLFGHLFYKMPFEAYTMQFEYRFRTHQAPGAPGWAFKNSGIMVHGQTIDSMRLDQPFPVSIEVQLLGGDGQRPRPTGNVCTPGTHIVLDDSLDKRHCISSNSDTFHDDQWVRCEIEVHAHDRIIHRINGDVVLEYTRPQLDADDPDAARLIAARNDDVRLSSGTLSIQAESHAVEFRNIRLREH